MAKDQFSLEHWQIQFFGYILNVENSFTQLIKPMPDLTVESCVQIYKRGYNARLTEVLGDTFEASWWVLGDEAFFKFAGEFISNIPSRSYDLSDYGSEFPNYLESQSISKEILFLPDLARFEWLFKAVFHESDISAANDDLSAQLSTNPDLKITINNQVHFFSSKYSVYDLWTMRSTQISSLSEINLNKEQNLIIFKKNGQIHSVQLSKSEYDLLFLFRDTITLEESVTLYQSKYGEFNPDIIQGLFSKIANYGILIGVK